MKTGNTVWCINGGPTPVGESSYLTVGKEYEVELITANHVHVTGDHGWVVVRRRDRFALMAPTSPMESMAEEYHDALQGQEIYESLIE
jgi:hypothetical protein